MPVCNECSTLRCVVERVLTVPLEIEALCVDDGSRDRSREILTAKRRLRIDEVGCEEGKR